VQRIDIGQMPPAAMLWVFFRSVLRISDQQIGAS
jgi:hypothetical protein